MCAKGRRCGRRSADRAGRHRDAGRAAAHRQRIADLGVAGRACRGHAGGHRPGQRAGMEPVQADPRAAEDVRRLARAEYLALQAAGRHRCRNRATPGRAADHAGAGAQAGAHVAHRAPARQSLKELAGDQYVARNAYLERERERIEQESDLAMQRSRLKEIEATIAEARQQRDRARRCPHASLNRLNGRASAWRCWNRTWSRRVSPSI